MGLNSYVFDLIATHVPRPAGPNARLLAAGYPDFLVYPEVLLRHLGRIDFPVNPGSEQLKAGHGEPLLDHVRDAASVFRAMGYSRMDVLDLYPESGCDIVVDLNQPWTPDCMYELVLDHGTIEHCFNIAQSAANLANAVAEDGFIVQHLPLNMYNHGFYNLNPTWFYHFYETNGFRIILLEGWCWETKTPFPAPAMGNFAGVPEDSLLTMIAQRGEMQEITWPIQRMYQR